MSPPQLDPVSVLITIAAAIFSQKVAEVVGPYAVILIASSLGAYYSLGTRETSTRGQGIKFFLAVIAAAMLFTVPLSVYAKPWLPDGMDESWIFGPMALCIGLAGDKLPRMVIAYVRAKVGSKAPDRFTGGGDTRR